MPGRPLSTTTCGLRSSSTRANPPFSCESSGPRPANSGSRALGASQPVTACGERAPERHRLGLPFGRDRRQRLVVDRLARALPGRLADDHAADRRRPEQARGGVDGVARDHALPRLEPRPECDGDVARVHGGAYRDLAERVVLVQLDDDLGKPERGPHRPLGVVGPCHGRAEDGHDRVAQELLDGAAEPVDLVADGAEVRPQERPHPLRVGAMRAEREVDQVDEQDGDVADLLVDRHLLDDLGAARAAPALRRLPDRLGLDPAGQRDRGEARVAEARTGALVGRLADGDAAGRRGALELARDVDDVAGDHADRSVALAIDGDRVGVHADADGEVEPRLLLVDLLDELRDAQRHADGALRVVTVAVVGAEDGDDGVADELLHAAAAALDLVLHARVERALERANHRRVGAVRARRETDEIGVEDGDEPLLVHGAIVAFQRTRGAGIAPGGLADSRGEGARRGRVRWM